MLDLAIPLRRRPELEAQQRFRRGVPRWLVRDPLTLRHWDYSDSEYGLLELLDGRRSFPTIREEFETLFAPLRLSREDFDRFLAEQHAQGVLAAEGSGQADTFRKRTRKRRRMERLRQWLNPLAIRLPPLFDPQPWLDTFRPLWGALFSPAFVVTSLLGFVLTLAFGLSRVDQIAARLPSLGALLGEENFLLLGVAVAFAKVLHELGHACACRRAGAECHELGVLLLVGVPCLYCDVSDVWRVRSRVRRIAVSLAGMWVEGLIAAAAFWVWWWSVPGIVHAVALNLVVVCSVGTLLFNLNPLLKYDGYHALADWIDVPNLGERSNRVLKKWLWDPLWGIPETPDPWGDGLSERGLAAYGLASAAYRLALTYVIALLVYRTLRDWEMTGPAVWLVGLIVVGAVVPAIAGVGKQIRAHRRAGRTWRAVVATLVLLACAGGLLAAPWPYAVRGETVFEPADSERIYVTAPGRIVEKLPEGASVVAGQRLALLENLDLDAELSRTGGEVSQQKILVETLRKRRGDSPTAARELPAAETRLEELTRQLEQQQRDRERLTIIAPRGGKIWSGDYRPRLPRTEQEDLPEWVETPLSEHSAHPWLETGTTLCLVATGDQWEAVAELSQGDVELIREGMLADVLLDRDPLKTLSGSVVSIARHTVPGESGGSTGTGLGQDRARLGTPRADAAVSTALLPYEVRIRLADRPAIPPTLRSRGKVRIHVGTWTVGRRIWRELTKTFKFET